MPEVAEEAEFEDDEEQSRRRIEHYKKLAPTEALATVEEAPAGASINREDRYVDDLPDEMMIHERDSSSVPQAANDSITSAIHYTTNTDIVLDPGAVTKSEGPGKKPVLVANEFNFNASDMAIRHSNMQSYGSDLSNARGADRLRKQRLTSELGTSEQQA